MRDYFMPTRLMFGAGALSELPQVLDARPGKILVVSNKAMRRLGTLDRIDEMLGLDRTVHFDPVSPNPTPSVVDAAAELFRRERCTAVVGLGGGSVLDVSKCAAIVQANRDGTLAYLCGDSRLEKTGAPVVAIPTTAGTGSEVTPWATVWDMKTLRKYSMEHQSMFPVAALIDPELTRSLPAFQTAVTGMDALSQAIEAYWSKRSQPVSDVHALEAVRLIVGNLETACAGGDNSARVAMSLGSLESGLAFSNTKTTICHSLSYPLTATFGIPHGQAVAITLPAFLRWNSEAIVDKMPGLLQAIEAESAGAAAARISSLMRSIGLETTFSGLGMKPDDLELVVDEGIYAGRADNNPRETSPDQVLSILRDLY